MKIENFVIEKGFINPVKNSFFFFFLILLFKEK